MNLFVILYTKQFYLYWGLLKIKILIWIYNKATIIHLFTTFNLNTYNKNKVIPLNCLKYFCEHKLYYKGKNNTNILNYLI